MSMWLMVAELASKLAQWAQVRGEKEAGKVRSEILDAVKALPDELQDIGERIAGRLETRERSQAEFLDLIAQMITRLEPRKPEAELLVEPQEYRDGKRVECRFYRLHDDPRKRGEGKMTPVGTMFELHLVFKNKGDSRTAVDSVVLTVKIEGEELLLTEPTNNGMICKDSNYLADLDCLRKGQRISVEQGGYAEVKVRMMTGRLVPDGVGEIEGTITCTDILGNTASAPCLLARTGEP